MCKHILVANQKQNKTKQNKQTNKQRKNSILAVYHNEELESLLLNLLLFSSEYKKMHLLNKSKKTLINEDEVHVSRLTSNVL